jgi:hypothetical protein
VSRTGQRWPDEDLAPCGTSAGAKRHYRRGERPCEECRTAANRERLAPGALRVMEPDRREVRNHLPLIAPYRWRARRYPLAEQALARAEAEHGRPASEAT